VRRPVFQHSRYGARNDGSAPATDAFRAAIQAAKAAGGGAVFVPAGKYVTGPIELVSNLTLYFDSGAVVEFPAHRLPFTEGREQGIECLTPVPLIGGRHLENVTVGGRGVLTTNNADWLKLMSRTRASANDPGTAFGANWEKLLQLLELRKPIDRRLYEEVAPEKTRTACA
jgi:polygalacturonase